MRVIPAGYVQALVTYGETMPGGVQKIADEFETLFDRMQKEEGLAEVNNSVNGRTFGFQVTMTVEEKFTAFSKALKILNGVAGDGPLTFIDFSRNNQSGIWQPPCP